MAPGSCWRASHPTYDPTNSYATKWGSTTLLTSGTPGGNVSYWFDTASAWSARNKPNGCRRGVVVGGSEHHVHARGGCGLRRLHPLSSAENQPANRRHIPNSPISPRRSEQRRARPEPGLRRDRHTVAGFGPIGTLSPPMAAIRIETLVHELGHLIGLGTRGPI